MHYITVLLVLLTSTFFSLFSPAAACDEDENSVISDPYGMSLFTEEELETLTEEEIKLLRYDFDGDLRVETLEVVEYYDPDICEWVRAAKDDILIRLADDIKISEMLVIAEKYDLQIIRRFSRTRPSFHCRITDGDMMEMLTALRADPRVKFAELNCVMELTQ